MSDIRKTAGEKHRERMAQRSRDQTISVSEVGPIPAVGDVKRKRKCRRSLLAFLRCYFPESTGLHPFSDDHKRFIARLQSTILEGGREIAAVYRGFAKSTIGENACLWGLLYGHIRFAVLLGADAASAATSLSSVKTELAANDLLAEDFPEVCHCIRALDGKPQRASSQRVGGKITAIGWTAESVVFPTIAGSPASGACIATKGFLAANRGLKHKLQDGKQLRPDFVMVDDPQTDESARSPMQCRARINKLYKTVLRLAGHRSRLAVFVAATVIEQGDMIDELLDAERHPSWRGERVPLVRQLSAAHDSLWLEKYAAIRNTFDRADAADRQRAHDKATAFYLENREAMDADCQVSWDYCYSEELGEVSAIQHAYNILIDDGPAVFASECQQAPIKDEEALASQLTAAELVAQYSTPQALPRYEVPQWADFVTVGIDVQQAVLFWLMAAWQQESFRGAIVDWGAWPRQPRDYFALSEVRRTLQAEFPRADTESAIYQGVLALLSELGGRRLTSPSGSEYQTQLALVDSGGTWAQTIYEACRQSGLGAAVMPSKGRGIRAKDALIADWAHHAGVRYGREWRLGRTQHRLVPLVTFNANYWKTALQEALLMPPGSGGALEVAARGGRTQDLSLRMLADQLLAERGVLVSTAERSAIEWDCPAGADNHLGDCLVMSAVAASVLGARRPGEVQTPRPRKTKKAKKL